MNRFAPAWAHGLIAEVFPDVFFVTGTFKALPGMSLPRNMIIVRQGVELTIINSVRLSSDGEAALEKLGRVKHLVRLGAAHGADDPYFMDRFKPTLWAPARAKHKGGLSTGQELRASNSPIAGAHIFTFDGSKLPEGVIILEREGGIAITCDSFQNWTTLDGSSFLMKLMLRSMKFDGPMVGPIWAKQTGPGIHADFDRLLALPFRHALSGHGAPVRDTGKEALKTAVAKLRDKAA